MAYVIFDLDHTVIDSSHRQLTKPDGSLDLDHWRENCTREKIMGDTLLPLADSMRRMYDAGHTIIVCTARVCTDHDMEFLSTHNLRFHHFISRDADDMRGDAAYKVSRLNALARELGYQKLAGMSAIMFDDNVNVLKAMRACHVAAIDAIAENKRLTAA